MVDSNSMASAAHILGRQKYVRIAGEEKVSSFLEAFQDHLPRVADATVAIAYGTLMTDDILKNVEREILTVSMLHASPVKTQGPMDFHEGALEALIQKDLHETARSKEVAEEVKVAAISLGRKVENAFITGAAAHLTEENLAEDESIKLIDPYLRHLAIILAAAAQGDDGQEVVQRFTKAYLKNNGDVQKLEATLLQGLVYLGYPAVLTAAGTINEVIQQHQPEKAVGPQVIAKVSNQKQNG